MPTNSATDGGKRVLIRRARCDPSVGKVCRHSDARLRRSRCWPDQEHESQNYEPYRHNTTSTGYWSTLEEGRLPIDSQGVEVSDYNIDIPAEGSAVLTINWGASEIGRMRDSVFLSWGTRRLKAVVLGNATAPKRKVTPAAN